MDSVDSQPPKSELVIKSLTWREVVPFPGTRTQRLIRENPDIGKLNPVIINEHVVEDSNRGIICLPGGLDRKTDDETMFIGAFLGESVFHVKYPSDSSFSIRREVSQILDHVESRGIKTVKFVTGSWGGIPTLNAAYNLVRDGSLEVDSIFMVAGALQPYDLAPMAREVAGNLGKMIMEIPAPIPGRQLLARVSKGVPDFQYPDKEVLTKLAQIPTVLLVPPGGKDWWVDARESYSRYLPQAMIVEYPAYDNLAQKAMTMGGHDAKYAVEGIRQIEKAFLQDPHSEYLYLQVLKKLNKARLMIKYPHEFYFVRDRWSSECGEIHVV